MKILTVLLLLVFINPAIANEPFSLYERSGGYEKSGGYERSGGYETSRYGYETSAGHKISTEGYTKSQEGYETYMVDVPERTRRLQENKYDKQINKSKMKKSRWVAERHQDEGTIQRFRSSFRESGGNDDLID